MSFLSPIWLVLTAAVAVPLFLHLLRRRIDMRREFPAARYLLRAEKENDRRLKLRNLLLMALRALTLLFLALAAARPIGALLGSGHVPTALAVVVDNSMSTGAIVDGNPLVARLKAAARSVVEGSATNDQSWLVTADGAVTGGARTLVLDAIDRVEPLGGRADLMAAITQAVGLVQAADLSARTVVVLTDGQASQWPGDLTVGDVRVVAYAPANGAPYNRAVTMADPRPPRWSPKGTVMVGASGADSVTFRVTLGVRTVARGLLRGSDEQVVRLEPTERGWVAGTVDLAPDELRGDDERHFAVWVGDAPAVSTNPGVGVFVREAVDALVQSELVTRGSAIEIAPVDEAQKLPALLLAPSDPVRLGAANRNLERLGIPWRLEEVRRDETIARGADLDGTSVRIRYPLRPATGTTASDTLATASGVPWIVAGADYVLVASPMSAEATALPVRAAFLPWLSNLLSQRLTREGSGLMHANPGAPMRLPAGVTGFEGDSQVFAVGAKATAPTRAGVFFLLRGEERVGALVVNPEREESRLDRLGAPELKARIRGRDVLVTGDAAEVPRRAFDASAQRPLQAILLLLALGCLIAEMLVVRRAEPRGLRRAA
ncbi:MAG TPA: BatA and WFA domain-containing protein [Gemmatimonadaceae bacterium]|nr:BatA and WFA domain-containing protein [Gemmatimonadaceae bacterium]